jgi:TRAP-type uncharacterized transport system substrate-binding protein
MTRRNSLLALSTVAMAAVFAAAVTHSAAAQQRKSLRWTTSQVGSYGYTIAASMAKIVEQALGGEYTVTVQPYQSPTVAMKAVMDGEGELAYTADIGMTQLQERVGPFKDYKPTKPEIVHTWYAYPMESMMATSAKEADKFKCWKDFSGKPVYFTQAGLPELAQLAAHLQDARLRLQARADRQQGERRCAGAGNDRGLRDLHHRQVARWRPTGRRPRCAWTSG